MARRIALPIPRTILQQHVAVLGKTRSGKSSTLRLLVEDLLEQKQPVCIIDPKGDWWGVKLAADGKKPGYPVVIFGGEHADIDIVEQAGARIAELVATGNRPCLIDLSGWTVGARTRFWIDFASTLFVKTKGQRYLVIDEVHNFAPKGKILSPDAGQSLHWTNRFASEGLGKGVTMLFASQRPQKVHNDTLTSAETLIAMRVIHPSDRGAVAEWIDGCGDSEIGKEVLRNLANLQRGEGWVWSPEYGFGPTKVKFPLFRTYDSFRPQTAADTRRLKGWAAVDLDEVRAKMGELLEAAAANNPTQLKQRVRDLEKTNTALQSQLAQKPSAFLTKVPTLTLHEQKLIDGLRTSIDTFGKTLRELHDKRLSEVRTMIEKALSAYQDNVTHDHKLFSEHLFASFERSSCKKAFKKIAAATTAAPVAGDSITFPDHGPLKGHRAKVPDAEKLPAVAAKNLPPGELATLTAVAERGESGVERKSLSVLTKYKQSSRDAHIFRLAKRGLVRVEKTTVYPTPDGYAALGPNFQRLPKGEELRKHWMEKLPDGERAVLELIVAHTRDGSGVSREEIGAALPYAKSSRDAYIFRLTKRELIDTGSDGRIRASEELF